MGQRPQLQYHHWEGIYAVDVTIDGLRRRAATLANLLIARDWSCIVASDTRFMASQFALDLFRTLEMAGVNCVYCAQPTPLPAIERALDARRADCAVLVSAGNRSYWYSGLHVITPALDHVLFAEPLAVPDMVRPFPPSAEPPEQSHIDLRSLYLDALRTSADIEFIRRTLQTVFIDAMGGTTGGYLTAVIGDSSQTRVVEINREPDVLFGRQPPHPAEANLVRLRKLMRESDSHLGVAISADGRALGAVDNIGDLITPTELVLIIAQHLSRQQRQRGIVVVPGGNDELMGGLAYWDDTYGLKIEQSESAALRISELCERDRSMLVAGVTATGEVTLGRATSFSDALVATLTLIEAVARSGLKLRPLLQMIRGR